MRSGSYAIKTTSLFLLLAVSLLPNTGCIPSDSPLETIILGEQVEAEDSNTPLGDTVSPAQESFVIDSITVVGSLIQGQQCLIGISCLVSSVDGIVESVGADFSAAGGPKDIMLRRHSGNLWVWSGLITASVAGSTLVYMTATDNRSTVVTQATDVVILDDQSPHLTNAAAFGNLIVGQACTITVSCDTSEWGVDLCSLTADLSQVGGSSQQPLASTGSLWTWSGTVTPSTAGPAVVALTAVDVSSSVKTYAAEVVVNERSTDSSTDSDESGVLTNMAVTGRLIQGQSGKIIVSCRPSMQAGSIRSISVDLTALGGPSSQALTDDGSYWTWSGTITPPTGGTLRVTFTTTDANGTATTTSTTAGVVDTRITMAIPGVTKPTVGATWIEVNRLVQGEACSVRLACNTSVAGSSTLAVVADLSSIGGPSSQTMTWDGSQWTWSGTLAPPEHGIKHITITATNHNGDTTIVATTVGVKDSQVLRGNWMFVMPDSSWSPTEPFYTNYVDAFVRNVETSGVPVVLLQSSIWDWKTGVMYKGKVLAGGSFSQAQVMHLVDRLRSIPGVTVGFHACPTGGLDGRYTSDRDVAWLLGDAQHPGALAKLTMLNAKLVYADGSTWKTIAFYEQSLRSAIGPDGIMIEGDIGDAGIWLEGNSHLLNIDGCSTRDQCGPHHSYYMSHPRQFADWRIGVLSYYKTFLPAWTRFEIGWVGEWSHVNLVPLSTTVPLLPSSDYEYIWGRAREHGIALTYRTPAEYLGRQNTVQNEERLQRIGVMQQSGATTATVYRRWTSVAVSANGATLAAAAYGGRLFTSTDYGATWTEQQPAGSLDRTWNTLVLSADGTKIIAGVWNGRLYIGTFNNLTQSWIWSETRPAGNMNMYIQSAALSADGKKIVVRPNDRSYYTSNDSGQTWTLTRLPGQEQQGDKGWNSVAMSADGHNLLLTDGQMLVDETGATCTPDLQFATEGWSINKSCVAISADGIRRIAGAWPNPLHISTDAGNSWTATNPPCDVHQYWQCVTMSANGTRVIAGAWPGRLYASSNTGATWSELRPAGNTEQYWESVAMSSDGTRIVATDGNRLYISADAGTNWSTLSLQ